MKIKIWIDDSYATLAVQHALNYGNKPTSKKKFIEAVKEYMENYGKLCVDDHEGEYAQHEDEAAAIVEKYYKP